ncbi:MAG: pyridoxal-phosphate dependent enzyme [Chloroflexi bacterium]|nr:pyridoxal-phosphate dependent enzyme [Chloroflexota bacterium]
MTTETAPDVEFEPATAEDLPLIRETADRMILDTDDLAPEQFITVRRDGNIIGFGRIRPYNETYELATLAVVEEERGHGLGEAISRELIRRFPQDEVYVVTDVVEYWERLGFICTDILPPELETKRTTACETLRPGATGMIYDRLIERMPTLADVYAARTAIAPHLQRTPLIHNPKLSRELDCDIHVKMEMLQPIGAFKVRGGINLASTLDEEERLRGIIGASTGNHGQSLAYAANLLGIPCLIAMPEEANPMKVESMRALGAQVEFHGTDFELAREWAEGHARETGMRYVHHVNSPELVAGVATISIEIIEDLPDVDVIIAPVGGGSSAVSHCIVAKALRPEVEVIGVQAAGAPAFYRSWKERRIQEAGIDTAAEGLATGRAYYVAVKTFIDHLDDMVLVTEDEIDEAIRTLIRTTHVVAEQAGATSTAAAMQIRDSLKGKKVVLIASGGNLTLDALRRILNSG